MTHGEEIRAMNRQIQSAVTLAPSPPSLSHGDSLLDLPSHLAEEILFRVPVKYLLRLQCLCKQLNSLISDLKFQQNHLRSCLSTNNFQLQTISPLGCGITSFPIHSIFSSIDLYNATTNIECPRFNRDNRFPPFIAASCDGILCIADHGTDFILMCNPSIRKFKELPLPLEEESPQAFTRKAYGFGYDHSSHSYKVVVVKGKTQVKIFTLGTHSWRRVDDFLFGFPDKFGVSLSGTVNWLTSNDYHRTNPDSPCLIVSLDLENESFQTVPQPNYGRTIPPWLLILSVQRDCLCLIADHDIWIMKEFGNQSSWTKLFTIPYLRYPSTSYGFNKLLYVSEDDKVMLDAHGLQGKLLVYDSRNGLIKYHNMQNTPHLSIVSLISP